MKIIFTKILFYSLFFPSFVCAQQTEEVKKPSTTPLFQLSAGMVYSSIDLTRYSTSVSYRGYHGRIVTHLGGMFFISAEYSAFPIHDSPSAWKNVSTRKIDLNGHVSFSTNANLTHIFVLAGVNQHAWQATRTNLSDPNQLAKGIPAGEIVHVNRTGVNLGCGFTQVLYENIGLFGDYRFCFANAKNFEKVTILDVMTTIGINFTIPHPSRSNSKKNYGIGNKLYKWTRKGAKQ